MAAFDEQQSVPEYLEKPSIELWEDAHDRMFNTASHEELSAALLISLRRDPDQIAAWRDEQAPHLTPETIYFLHISEAVKRSEPQDEHRPL